MDSVQAAIGIRNKKESLNLYVVWEMIFTFYVN